MAKRSPLPMEAAMTEVLIALSLFAALVWVVARAVLLLIQADTPDDATARNVDPIATYVEENYGSHFVEDPITVNQTLRNL
jgi:hypothetical protein